MASRSAPREPGINAFRLVSLSAVILAHAWFFAGPMEHHDPRYRLVIIAQASVPLFFMTSGYLLRWRDGDPLAVTRWCCRKLLPLFGIWAAIYVGVFWIAGFGSLTELLATLPRGGPTRHLWFLPALAIALSSVSLSLRLAGPRLTWIGATALAAAGLWLGTYQQWIGLEAHSLASGVLAAPFFVLIGVQIRQSNVPRNAALFAGIAVAGYILQLLDDRLLSAAPGYLPERHFMVTLATVPYAGATFLFARSLSGRLVQTVARARDYFPTIYCIHPMIIFALRPVVHSEGLPTALAVAALTLALSILTAMALPAAVRASRRGLVVLPQLRAAAQP
jgi:surface polysaccharide O-acyltransferase-like enzyme